MSELTDLGEDAVSRRLEGGENGLDLSLYVDLRAKV